MPSPKLRVLCLHGYTQNGKKFRDRTGPFRRALKARLDLTYATAPNKATEFQDPGSSDDRLSDDFSAAWWNRSDETPWPAIKLSLDALKSIVDADGPFDAVLGFSQGSVMAAILCAIVQCANAGVSPADADLRAAVDQWRGVDNFKFAFLFSGLYPDADSKLGEILESSGLISCPSLHLVGEGDHVVPMERGKELARRAFVHPQVMVHEGGHFVPCNAAWRKKYQAFLEDIGFSPASSASASDAEGPPNAKRRPQGCKTPK